MHRLTKIKRRGEGEKTIEYARREREREKQIDDEKCWEKGEKNKQMKRFKESERKLLNPNKMII